MSTRLLFVSKGLDASSTRYRAVQFFPLWRAAGFEPVHVTASGGPGATLGIVSDTFGDVETPVMARDGGLVIGQTRLPVVNRGDALFHVARYSDTDYDSEGVSFAALAQSLDDDPLLDSVAERS